MTDEVANPATGAMTVADAVASLTAPPKEDKPQDEPAPVDEPEADAAEVEEASDEDEAEPEAEAETDDTEEAESDPPRHRVKIDGEEVEVTLDELLAGYQRQADYTRKTQTVAEERKAAEAERKRQEEITARLSEMLGQDDDKAPDWAKLADELDPWEFQRRRAKWDAEQAQKQETRRQVEQIQAQRRAELAAQQAQMLRDKVPEWRDGKKFIEDFEAITKVAADVYGFDPNEVGKVVDHRLVLLLRDAAEMQRIRAGKPDVAKKVRAAPPKVVKPGATESKAARAASDRDALRQRLRKTGSVEDAVAFLKMG